MAQEQQHPITHDTNVEHDQINDRGILDFLEKKEEEKPKDELSVPEFAKVHVAKSEEKKEEEENKPSFTEKLHRSNSSSSSSSEEEGEGGKKKKNKGMKEKDEDELVDGDVARPGFVEKIKEKLPGTHKKTDEESAPTPTQTSFNEPEAEKKGFMEKIKEKLPGHDKNGEEKEGNDNGLTY